MKKNTQTRQHPAGPSSEVIETSLYDLIEAITEDLPPGREALVTEVIKDMLQRGFKLTRAGRIITIH